MRYRFRGRRDAGQRLAVHLSTYVGQADVLVVGLARGGVPEAYEVARGLRAPLDIMLVRKLGVPGHEELAMGAIASGGIRILSDDVIAAFGITEPVLAAVTAVEQEELERQERSYRDDRPPPVVRGRTVILVDDGLATGSTMLAAAGAIQRQSPERVIVAVPVAPPETCRAMRHAVDEVICVGSPEPFFSVGTWYRDFSQVSDDEVHELLDRAEQARVTVP